MEKLEYDIDYLCGPFTTVDWVAGGNFDGYVYRKVLRFRAEGRLVHMHFRMLDQSRYDGETEDQTIRGTFAYTDHDTLTCTFPGFSLRGVILGDQNQYLAFSVNNARGKRKETQCYERAGA